MSATSNNNVTKTTKSRATVDEQPSQQRGKKLKTNKAVAATQNKRRQQTDDDVCWDSPSTTYAPVLTCIQPPQSISVAPTTTQAIAEPDIDQMKLAWIIYNPNSTRQEKADAKARLELLQSLAVDIAAQDIESSNER